ncbi:MAG: hypothetical protein ACJ75B_17130 [Flavisolibacter sp.]
MKLFLVLLLLTVECISAHGQRLRLNAYGSYQFDDGFSSHFDDNNFYSGKVNGGAQWGAGLEYMLRPSYCIEFLYLHQSTHSPVTWQAGKNNPVKSENPKLDYDCLFLGSDVHHKFSSSSLEGYAGLFLGEAYLHLNNVETGTTASTSKFSFSARMGCNIWLLDRLGVKLQAQFLSIVRGTGNDFYFGTYGNNVGLNDYSGIYQFGLGGGLSLKLGGQKKKSKYQVM